MSTAESQGLTPQELLRVLVARRRLWMIPTVAGAVLGLVIAIVMPRKWEASQALHVRQVAVSGQLRPGSFSTLSEMKTLQETILEVAKSRSVLETTLKKVGPPPDFRKPEEWPSAQSIEDFRDGLRMTPPDGAEFGKTEIFYLQVRSKDRQRALEEVSVLCDSLIRRFQKLRDERAQSMMSELERATAMNEADLAEATTRLAEFEARMGTDLGELRILQSSPSGTSDLRQKLIAMGNAQQLQDAKRRQNEQLLDFLKTAQMDPQALIATPNSLLAAQPALSRLKDALVDSQLRIARLSGLRHEGHPLVVAAVESEREIQQRLRKELEIAIRGAEIDLQLADDGLKMLNGKIAKVEVRLERLAGHRADYANLLALADNRTKLLETARKNFTDARASRASARGASLIGRIDAPDIGIDPVGPGRTVVAGAGLVGGFLVGLGLVFLFALPPSRPHELSGRQDLQIPHPAQQHVVQSVTAEVQDSGYEAESRAAPSTPAVTTDISPPKVAPIVTENAMSVAEQPTSHPTQEDSFALFSGMTLRESLSEVARCERKEAKAR